MTRTVRTWALTAAGLAALATALLGAVSLLLAAAAPAGESAPQTLVIAHRGASGYLPEHTLPAYALAYGQGADYLEPDVVLSRDGHLVCLHDLTLNRMTNVETVFPDRAREAGQWYAIDFTLAELKTLTVDAPPRHARTDDTPAVGTGYRLAALTELLDLVRLLNQRTGRTVGVIPEPKNAAFHRREGRALEGRLVVLLRKYGYVEPTDACIIQSFEADALRRIRDEFACRLRLVYLAGGAAAIEHRGGLAKIQEFADGLGPSATLAEANDARLIRAARQIDLPLYPYTFTTDEAELRRFIKQYRVAGVFADFPDLALRVRDP